MVEELNKKELDKVNGGYTSYFYYTLYWSCPEDNIFDKYEMSTAYDGTAEARNGLSARKNEIRNEHAGKTVTFRDEKVNQRRIESP